MVVSMDRGAVSYTQMGSVNPVQTELGRKAQVDQTSCNSNYSCLDGDCLSFVTVRTRSRPARRADRGPEMRESDRVAQVGAAATRSLPSGSAVSAS
jgi:indolepyruvate ferredoxin oxidoreductase